LKKKGVCVNTNYGFDGAVHILIKMASEQMNGNNI
jgi:hypothetical protein